MKITDVIVIVATTELLKFVVFFAQSADVTGKRDAACFTE